MTVDDLGGIVVPLADLKPFPGNAKTHDGPAIRESLTVNGQYRPVVVARSEDPAWNNVVLAGNGTTDAARDLGWDTLRVTFFEGDEAAFRRVNLADNRVSELGAYNDELLLDLLDALHGNFEGTGWDTDAAEELNRQLAAIAGSSGPTVEDPDAIPDEPVHPFTNVGDVWQLGPHRIACGDTTDPNVVTAAVGGQQLVLLHADPPYGMGKEADGVLNDNTYGAELDAFQMRWWTAWEPHLTENASAYVWGTAPDLWRLWYVGGLAARPDLTLRNEIVWDKGSGMGMGSNTHHSYATTTERCLFVMRGQQFLGNQNQDDYWEGYEPLRSWLEGELEKVGWNRRTVNELTGTQMAGHWFSRSQFSPITPDHYETLQRAAEGRAFVTPYDELFSTVFPGMKGHLRELGAALRENRSYFDNVHDIMRDVWDFPRVQGEERHGHATPKPVAMMERALKTSAQEGDWVGVPFGGTGPEFIAGHLTGRNIVAVELNPAYVDVVCRRYQTATGIKPVLLSTGEPHDFLADA